MSLPERQSVTPVDVRGTGQRPRALDLFCCAGGATKGLQRAGFHVTGVDIRPQPRYCGDAFHQGDALTFPVCSFRPFPSVIFRDLCERCGRPYSHDCHSYDFVWASPPCEFGSQLTPREHRAKHPNLIDPTRIKLLAAGVPFCIENVPSNAKFLNSPLLLCGSQFGLKVRRHRFFELSFPVGELLPQCDHSSRPVLISGTHRRTDEPRYEYTAQQCRDAADMQWMRRVDMDKAIPPAYAEWIGRQALSALPLSNPSECSDAKRNEGDQGVPAYLLAMSS